MGKVAKCLGIGIKGSLRVLLHRESYAAGDLVQGQVVFKVARPIDCEYFSMHVEGAESVAWSEGANQTSTHHSRRDEFLREAIALTEAVPKRFEPGEYRFHFSYHLDDALPPVFRVYDGFAGVKRSVNASVVYAIKVCVGVRGKLAADLQAARELMVHPASLCHPVRTLERSSSDQVRLLSLVKSKGACEVAATMDSDVCIAGSTLAVQARISNYSSRDIQSMSVLFYEDLTVEVPQLRATTGTRVVCRRDFPGVAAGQLLDEVLYLPLLDDASGHAIAATTSAAFVRWHYRVEIKCRFVLSPSVKVDMPVIVLRNVGEPPVPEGGASPSPAVVVVVPGDEEDAEQQEGEFWWIPSQMGVEDATVVARSSFALPQAIPAA